MLRTLPLIDELEAALSSGTNARRIEMLTRVTDLFVGGATRYSEEQIGIFDDVMVRLMSGIETKARSKLSYRLAPIANAPSNVIYMLAFDDDIEVAQPILRASKRLQEPALLANASTKSQQHLFAISQRSSLSEAVTDVLVERGDRDVVHSVVKNVGARFSDAGFRMLVKHSEGDDDLATTVGMRSDIPRPHFLVLLEKASSALRSRLAAENPQASSAIEGVVAEVVGGIRDNARNSSPDFAAAQAAVERQNRVRRIGEVRNLSIRARAQVRGDGDRVIDPVRHADRRRRAGAARPGRRDCAHSRQGRRTFGDHDQGHLAAAGRRPRHVHERP